MPQCLDHCREMFGYSKWIIQGLTDRQTQGNEQLIIEANTGGDILTSRNHESKMRETYFNSCEVVLLQEKCRPFQLSRCVNRSLAIYITQAVTGHNEHERKPKVRWFCKTEIPAVADIQTGRQMLPDRVCCIHVRYQARLLPFLSIHYNSETPQISPRATWGKASPGNNGFCFNKLYVKLCKLFF